MPPRPSLKQERAAWADERLLVGVDEAGRGPLAGPVVAAAVVFPVSCSAVRGLRDSKILPARVRLKLARRIRERALADGRVKASPLARRIGIAWVLTLPAAATSSVPRSPITSRGKPRP